MRTLIHLVNQIYSVCLSLRRFSLNRHRLLSGKRGLRFVVLGLFSLLLMASSATWAEGPLDTWYNEYYPTEDILHQTWRTAFTALEQIELTKISNNNPSCTITFLGDSIDADDTTPFQYDTTTRQLIYVTKDVYFLDVCPSISGPPLTQILKKAPGNPGSSVYEYSATYYQCWDNTYQSSASLCPTKQVCPEGQILNSGTRLCESISNHKKLFGDCCTSSSPNSKKSAVGNPINIAIANKYEKQVDDAGNSLSDIRFMRSYNSGDDTVTVLGPGWHHNYDRHIDVNTDGTLATFTHGDGRVANYRPYLENIWITDTDEIGTLTQTPSGWSYQLGNAVETYDTTGRLLSLTNEAGRTQILSYNSSGQLSRVDGVAGAFLIFSYSSDGSQLLSVSDATRTWSYQYDGSGHLIVVVNPDGTARQYLYEDGTHLTGLIDERGIRYATWGYDSQGWANLTTHADNAEYSAITYPSDTTRTVTDGRGNTTTYTMLNQNGSLIVSAITGPACATCGGSTHKESYTYNSEYNEVLSKTIDGLTTWYYNFDINHNPGLVYEAVGTTLQRAIKYIYDPRYVSKVIRKTEPSACSGYSKVTTTPYDNFTNPTSISVSGYTPPCTNSSTVSRITTMQYDGPLNQLSQIDGPRTDVSDITTFTHYPDDPTQGNNRARLQRITLANGTIARDNIQYSATGKVLSETRPNGLSISYTYYAGNDRLQTASVSDGTTTRTTRWTYLPTGEVQTIILGDGTPEATTLMFGYDDARRLTHVTDGAGNYIEYTLDTEGNHTAENVYDNSGVLHRTLTQTFDAYNRLASMAQANESHDYTFSPDGTLSSDMDGNLTTANYSYDALKRLLTSTQDVGGADPSTADALTKYTYNSHDDLTSVIDPNNGTTTYQYDDFGRVVSQTGPDTGTTTMTYDPANNMLTRTDAKGQTFTYAYDALNRLISVTAPVTDDSISYTYDSCANGVGRLCSVTQGSQVTTYSYDAFGDVTATQSVAYDYDTLGRIKTVTYPSGDSVTYHYDLSGQISSVDGMISGAPQILASNISYAPFGPLTSLTYGNGAVLTQTVDTAYRITAQNVPGIYQRNYTQYDPNGNLRAFTDTLASVNDVYGYDALNRLTNADGGFGAQSIGYDKNGNRLSWTTSAGVSNYVYAANSNRLSSVDTNTYVLDANGNTTSDGRHSYTFNTHNQLTGVDGVITYSYNALGQRVAKDNTGNQTTYVYNTAGQLLAEYTNGVMTAEYVYLNGVPLAVVQQGNVYYIHTDQLGIPRAVSDQTQKVIWTWASDPFGSTAANDDPDGDGVHFTLNLRFPGQYYDAETGLYYNYFRYYDPSTGRYITSDLIGLAGGLNTYGYVFGNPVSKIDPLGLSGYDPTGNDIGRLVGQNAVYPSTMNCKAVLDCEERLDKYDSGTIDIPKNDPLNELLKDGGKQTVQEFIIDYGKGSLCAYMNQEKCEGFNPDMPTWPPEPEPKQCPSEKKK